MSHVQLIVALEEIMYVQCSYNMNKKQANLQAQKSKCSVIISLSVSMAAVKATKAVRKSLALLTERVFGSQ